MATTVTNGDFWRGGLEQRRQSKVYKRAVGFESDLDLFTSLRRVRTPEVRVDAGHMSESPLKVLALPLIQLEVSGLFWFQIRESTRRIARPACLPPGVAGAILRFWRKWRKTCMWPMLRYCLGGSALGNRHVVLASAKGCMRGDHKTASTKDL